MRLVLARQQHPRMFLATFDVSHEDKEYIFKHTLTADTWTEADRKAKTWAEEFFMQPVNTESEGRCYVTLDGYEKICLEHVDEYENCDGIFRALLIDVKGSPELESKAKREEAERLRKEREKLR